MENSIQTSSGWLARADGFLQRFAWILPLTGFVGGWTSFVLIQRGHELAQIVAVAVLLGWVWLFLQPLVRRIMEKLGAKRFSTVTVNFVTQSIQQEILFFVLPFLVLSTRIADPGQVIFTFFVVLVALLSTIDPLYERYVNCRPLVCLAFHSLCSFIAALIVLPIVVKIPVEKSFNIAMGFVLLWLVVGAPLSQARQGLSLRALGLALLFPLLLVATRSHIPAAGIVVERAVVTSGIRDHEPVNELAVIPVAQLSQGVYVHVAISAPLGLSQEIEFNWRHAESSESISAMITGGRAEGFRTYASKQNFGQAPEGEWIVDVRTPQGQLLERVTFLVTGQQAAR